MPLIKRLTSDGKRYTINFERPSRFDDPMEKEVGATFNMASMMLYPATPNDVQHTLRWELELWSVEEDGGHPLPNEELEAIERRPNMRTPGGGAVIVEGYYERLIAFGFICRVFRAGV